MKVKPKRKPSGAVIRRMPKYYRYLCDLSKAEETKISSGRLAVMMGLTASQVRQDFNCFGDFGQQGYGYPVEDLRMNIAAILGINRQHQAIVVGAGNLGNALLSNFNFANCGVKVIAAFDVRADLVGREIGGVPVLSMDKLKAYVTEKRPDIGILTLPKESANDVAALLCRCGVQGLWNFTNIDISLPNGEIQVENVHLDESLMVLFYQLEAANTVNGEGLQL